MMVHATVHQMTELHCDIVPANPNKMHLLIKGRPTFSVLSVSTMIAGKHLIILLITMPPMPRKLRLLLNNVILMPTRSISHKKQLGHMHNLLLPLNPLQLMWLPLPLILKLNIKIMQSAQLTFMSSTVSGSTPTKVAGNQN